MILRFLIGLIVSTALVGCSSANHPSASTPRPGSPSDSEVSQAMRLADNIERAPTARDEADALKRLQRWAAEHKMIYQTRSVRANGVDVIEHPTAAPFPVNTRVTIFRGQEPLYTFTFTPRDNANLVLLDSSL